MKVTVSCMTKFHSFHLAEQLQKHGVLHKLITGHFDPHGNARGYNIDASKVATNSIPLGISFAPRFIPGSGRRVHLVANLLGRKLFDKWASKQLEPCDIFTGWAGYSLSTLRKAKSLGAVTILERGSSHILHQKEILEEEHARFGIKEPSIDGDIVERQLKEFAEVDYISIPSSFVRRTFVEKGFPEEKLIQIPYGVNLDHFKPVAKEDTVFRVMHIGGTIQKGTHYLIRAMDELGLENTELFLIGSPNRHLRAMLGRYGGHFKLVQQVPHLELYKVYSQSSVYVLPSIQEGWGMVQAEAMACGVPVICSTNTGGEDIIRDGVDGFVVPVRDVAALKEKILYLYEHEKERRRMGQSALKRAKDFTWDKYGKRVVEVYRRLIDADDGKME